MENGERARRRGDDCTRRTTRRVRSPSSFLSFSVFVNLLSFSFSLLFLLLRFFFSSVLVYARGSPSSLLLFRPFLSFCSRLRSSQSVIARSICFTFKGPRVVWRRTPHCAISYLSISLCRSLGAALSIYRSRDLRFFASGLYSFSRATAIGVFRTAVLAAGSPRGMKGNGAIHAGSEEMDLV